MARAPRKTGAALEPRPAARSQCPVPSTADVVMMIRSEIFAEGGLQTRHTQLVNAATCVLAATMRIGPANASEFLFDDWNAGRIVLPTWFGDFAPPVLPVTKAVIARMTAPDVRPKGAAPNLFVHGKGRKLATSHFNDRLARFGARCRVPGRQIVSALHRYFDRVMYAEADRAAVCALARGRRTPADEEVTTAEIRAAMDDPERLLEVLNRSHPLAGDPALFLDGPPPPPSERTLFVSEIQIHRPSPAMSTDPVCIALARVNWPAHGYQAIRKDLMARHFDHLADLNRAGALTRREIAFLLRLTVRTVEDRLQDRRLRTRSEEELAVEADWRERAPALYLARPRMENFDGFFKRLRARMGYTLPRMWLLGTLQRAGVLGPRRRGRRAAA